MRSGTSSANGEQFQKKKRNRLWFVSISEASRVPIYLIKSTTMSRAHSISSNYSEFQPIVTKVTSRPPPPHCHRAERYDGGISSRFEQRWDKDYPTVERPNKVVPAATANTAAALRAQQQSLRNPRPGTLKRGVVEAQGKVLDHPAVSPTAPCTRAGRKRPGRECTNKKTTDALLDIVPACVHCPPRAGLVLHS